MQVIFILIIKLCLCVLKGGIYENGQGYVYCHRHRDMGAYAHLALFILFYFILKNTSGYKYGIEHTIRFAPSTSTQLGRKERIHIRHKHKQDTGNSHVHAYIHTCTCT